MDLDPRPAIGERSPQFGDMGFQRVGLQVFVQPIDAFQQRRSLNRPPVAHEQRLEHQ